jgi:hypothetical protein
VDAEDGTRFSTDEDQVAGLYYEVNMGSAQTFDELDMATTNTDYPAGYEVEVSANGTTWTEVASCAGPGASPAVVSFPSQTDQYLEVVLTAASTTSWWSIMQFDIYGPSGNYSWAGFPSTFWGNGSGIPAAGSGNLMELSFLNETGDGNDPTGSFPNSEVYWDINGTEYSIAQEPYYALGTCTSCRATFYLGSPNSDYNDFIEFDTATGADAGFNGDTSRVDALGLPLAMHLHNADGSDLVIGEDYGAFSETRSALFTAFENAVPSVFQQLATVNAPYTIVSPTDDAAFQPGGADASYMVSYAAAEGATETTQEVFGCQGGGTPALNGDPALCAALNRCVAQFSATVQDTPADFYQNPPCNYYSMFMHQIAVNGLAYGFAYDDDNGQSSDIASGNPVYLQVAIGW